MRLNLVIMTNFILCNSSAPVTKKPPANSHANNGKGGNKKAGNKDPKQGNLFSFFKKV